ncbi:MAG TPA: hypothetical protein VK982_12405, partial [Bacteroidales bacterium]|nr:hypothetical protein [Bacteroidales bacterium]
ATDSIYVDITEVSAGTQVILSETSTTNVRRAYPITMTESGLIKSVVFYHDADTVGGGILVGIYSNSGTAPYNRLAYSDGSAIVTNAQEWQEIDLIEPVYVEEGTTIWVAWVIENAVGMYYQAGSTPRAGTSSPYSNGMPDPFGAATFSDYDYSVYIKYVK